MVEETNKERDKRSLTVQEVLGPGGIADIMDELRAQGLCDWIGLTGLGDPGPLHQVIDSGRFDAVQIYYNLLNPTAMAERRPGLELHRLRRPPAPMRGPGHGRDGHPHFRCRAPRF